MNDDLISRQTMLEGLASIAKGKAKSDAQKSLMGRVMFFTEQLPSAQPEIIQCKDCKNSEHWYGDRRRCFLWSEDGVSVFDDGFCNYAERRRDG